MSSNEGVIRATSCVQPSQLLQVTPSEIPSLSEALPLLLKQAWFSLAHGRGLSWSAHVECLVSRKGLGGLVINLLHSQLPILDIFLTTVLLLLLRAGA